MNRKTVVSKMATDRDREPSFPRVVILEDRGQPRVEVLELPETTALGASFFHSGTHWLVADMRTGDRVLIARPARA